MLSCYSIFRISIQQESRKLYQGKIKMRSQKLLVKIAQNTCFILILRSTRILHDFYNAVFEWDNTWGFFFPMWVVSKIIKMRYWNIVIDRHFEERDKNRERWSGIKNQCATGRKPFIGVAQVERKHLKNWGRSIILPIEIEKY